MAVAFDAQSTGTTGTGNVSWTHTPVGTPRAIRVVIFHINSGVDQVTGVTYGGVAMTEISVSPLLKTTGEAGAVYVYFLGAGIPTGAQTVEVTQSGAQTKVPFATSFTAAGDTEIVNTLTVSSDSLANPSGTLGLLGRTCFCLIDLLSGQNAITGIAPLAGWTSREEGDLGIGVVGLYTYDTVSNVDVTAGWTQTAEDAQAIAVAISELVAAGATRNLLLNQAVNRASTY